MSLNDPNSLAGSSTGANGTVDLGSQVVNVLPLANGGTAAGTASAALTNLLPAQSGNTGKCLTTNGSIASWASGGGAFTGLSGQTSINTATVTLSASNVGQLIRLSAGSGTQSVTMPPANTCAAGSIIALYDVSLSYISLSTSGSDTFAGTVVSTGRLSTSSQFTLKVNEVWWFCSDGVSQWTIIGFAPVNGVIAKDVAGLGLTAWYGSRLLTTDQYGNPALSSPSGGLRVGTDGAASLNPSLVVTTMVSTLAYAASLTLDVSTGNFFAVTLTGNLSLGNPTNATDGQLITLRLTQDATGSRTVSWGTAFRFSTSLPQPTLSTAAGKTDYISFRYNAAASKWDCSGIVIGN